MNTRSISFSIPGPPVPKGRPRTVRAAGKVRTFTPERTRRYERHVGLCCLAARPAGWPLDARYSVTLRVYGARANADLDNVAKAVLDGAEGVLWANDRQVERVTVERFEAKPGLPGVAVTAEVRS